MKRIDTLIVSNGNRPVHVAFEFDYEDIATIMAALSIAGGVMRQQGELLKDQSFKDRFRIFASELQGLWT